MENISIAKKTSIAKRSVFLCFVLAIFFCNFLLAKSSSPIQVAQEVSDEQTQTADSLVLRWELYNKWYSPEKLYMHIDRSYYAIGETIWFNAYLTNASPLCQKQLSNYIYVELLNKDGICVAREKVKVNDTKIENVNCFTGQIVIDNGIKTGDYTLRAYTTWQRNRNAEYFFNQKIRIKGEDDFSTEAPEKGGINVSFYPEGGTYFTGHPATIAFKALNPDGKSVEISGKIVDAAGNMICENIRSTHDGMGSFSFTALPDMKYFMEIEGAERFPLPDAVEKGASLHVVNTSNAIYVNSIFKNMDSQYQLYLRDNCSMYLLDILDPASENAQGKVFEKKNVISTKNLRSGLNHIMLADRMGNIISERLFFVYARKNAQLNGKLEFEKTEYGKRERIRSLFSLNDASGAPLNGTFSISVVRGAFSAYVQNDDIVSYMEMSSELKGKINNPAYYFNNEIPLMERRNNLDLLMMVQGWRYYDLDRIMAMNASAQSSELNEYFNLKHNRELSQSISGKVEGVLGSKRTKKYDLNILIPSQNAVKSVYVYNGSSFYVDSLDFPANTAIIVSSVKKNGIGSYKPIWNGDSFAERFKYSGLPYSFNISNGGSVNNESVENTVSGTIASEVNDMVMDFLVATVVTAYKKELGMGNAVGVENRLGSLAPFYADRPVLDYILAAVPSFRYDYSSHTLHNITCIWPSFVETPDPTGMAYGDVIVEINGTRNQYYTEELEHLMTSEVEVERVTTTGDALNMTAGGIVSLKLDGSRIKHNMDPTTIHFVPTGYQEPDSFYSPNYMNGSTSEENDFRNTLYWSPAVTLSNGSARVNFSNSDLLDYPYIIRIEGVTSNGQPFSWHGTLESK